MHIKTICRFLLTFLMVGMGTLHFVMPEPFVQIMPAFLPWPLELVYTSGAFEILGGVGLLIPSVSRQAAWGLILLYIAVFPANVNMAVNQIQLEGMEVSPIFLWIRLPLQIGLIAWAWWFTQPNPSTPS